MGEGLNDVSHTRIMDYARSRGIGPKQEDMPSNYASSPGPLDGLGPDGHQVEMLGPQ